MSFSEKVKYVRTELKLSQEDWVLVLPQSTDGKTVRIIRVD